MYEINQEPERVILVGVNPGEQKEIEDSLEELAELVKTAGAQPIAKIMQNREAIHPGTYVGKGKVEEIRQMIVAMDATGIVCDDELSPAQLKNLEEILDIKVMDRTLIILDIFAGRAVTKEGKIQVELAQLKYRQARLVGLGNSLSRLGGGIGTRGPGEKKLEMDRRLIKERIAQLRQEVAQIEQHRKVLRAGREKQPTKVCAIVGYTNAGKSTLLNTLTDASVLEEDKLFATLDPTTRNLILEDGEEIRLTDTVGFIRKLPHHLIDAFRSTLEEAKYADIILHVVDCSNPQRESHMETVYQTLKDLKVGNKPVITIFNKIDRLEKRPLLKDERADAVVWTSIRQKQGLETLLAKIEEILRQGQVYMKEQLNFEQAGILQQIRKYGKLLKEEYTPQGIEVEAYLPQEVYASIKSSKIK